MWSGSRASAAADRAARRSPTAGACALVLGLAGHAMVETFSVLTRLPGSSRLTAAHAARLISRELPGSVALPRRASPWAPCHSSPKRGSPAAPSTSRRAGRRGRQDGRDHLALLRSSSDVDLCRPRRRRPPDLTRLRQRRGHAGSAADPFRSRFLPPGRSFGASPATGRTLIATRADPPPPRIRSTAGTNPFPTLIRIGICPVPEASPAAPGPTTRAQNPSVRSAPGSGPARAAPPAADRAPATAS